MELVSLYLNWGGKPPRPPYQGIQSHVPFGDMEIRRSEILWLICILQPATVSKTNRIQLTFFHLSTLHNSLKVSFNNVSLTEYDNITIVNRLDV